MSTSSPTTTSRSLFFRFRVAAALLAVLVAVDVGLLFQNSWSKQDNAAIETRELRAVREALDAVDLRRAEVTDVNRRAAKIIDEKLSHKPPEASPRSPSAESAPPAAPTDAADSKPKE